MSKKGKLRKIHTSILIQSEQIELLAQYIYDYCETGRERQILSNIINKNARKILQMNDKFGEIMKF